MESVIGTGNAPYFETFLKELLEYCQSDVKLLKEGCLKFAHDTLQEAHFNPLTQCITIASTCHYFWRNYLMIPYSVAVEPSNRYVKGEPV